VHLYLTNSTPCQKPDKKAQTYKNKRRGGNNEGIPRRQRVRRGDRLPCFPKRCSGMPGITDSLPALSDTE